MTTVFGGPRVEKKPEKISVWEWLKLIVQPKRLRKLFEREKKAAVPIILGSGVDQSGETFIVIEEMDLMQPLTIEGNVWIKGKLNAGGPININGRMFMHDPNNPFDTQSWNLEPSMQFKVVPGTQIVSSIIQLDELTLTDIPPEIRSILMENNDATKQQNP